MRITVDISENISEDVWNAVVNARQEMEELVELCHDPAYPTSDLNESELICGIKNLNEFLRQWSSVPREESDCTCSSRDLLVHGCKCGWRERK